MSNSVDPDETAHMSRLIWNYAVCKNLLLSPVVVKELKIHFYCLMENSNANTFALISYYTKLGQLTLLAEELFVCVEVLRPSQPNWVMSSEVSLPNHTFTGQA